jgi:hypothetical protein
VLRQVGVSAEYIAYMPTIWTLCKRKVCIYAIFYAETAFWSLFQ